MGCFHPSLKVQSASLHFFLGRDVDPEEENDEVCHHPNLYSVWYDNQYFQQTVEEVRSATRDRGCKKSSHMERKLARSMKSAKKVYQAYFCFAMSETPFD